MIALVWQVNSRIRKTGMRAGLEDDCLPLAFPLQLEQQMTRNTTKFPRPAHGAPGAVPRTPLWSLLCMASLVLGCVAAALRRDKVFRFALGDILGVESIFLLGAAWLGYLRRDGVRFLQFQRGRSSESWKDRVPGLGSPPLPSRPIPGSTGPEDPEYLRLAAAEEELRKRISGGRAEPEPPDKARTGKTGFAAESALAGLILLAACLFLEYLI